MEKKTIMQEFAEIKRDTDKLQAMLENGEDQYLKTHSYCCDWKMINGFCLSCKDHAISQWEAGQKELEN